MINRLPRSPLRPDGRGEHRHLWAASGLWRRLALASPEIVRVAGERFLLSPASDLRVNAFCRLFQILGWDMISNLGAGRLSPICQISMPKKAKSSGITSFGQFMTARCSSLMRSAIQIIRVFRIYARPRRRLCPQLVFSRTPRHFRAAGP